MRRAAASPFRRIDCDDAHSAPSVRNVSISSVVARRERRDPRNRYSGRTSTTTAQPGRGVRHHRAPTPLRGLWCATRAVHRIRTPTTSSGSPAASHTGSTAPHRPVVVSESDVRGRGRRPSRASAHRPRLATARRGGRSHRRQRRPRVPPTALVGRHSCRSRQGVHSRSPSHRAAQLDQRVTLNSYGTLADSSRLDLALGD